MYNREFKITLTYDSVDLVLTHNPTEWDELGLNLERHSRYKSVWPSYSENSLTFIREGAQFIKAAFDADGFDFSVQIKVEQLNHSIDDYEVNFIGELNSETYEYIDISQSVKVSITESSQVKKVQDRGEIPYSLDLEETADGNTPQTIDVYKQLDFRRTNIYEYAKIYDFIYSFGAPEDIDSAESYIESSADINAFSDKLTIPQTSKVIYDNSAGTEDVEINFLGYFGSDTAVPYMSVAITAGSIDYNYGIVYKLESSAGLPTYLIQEDGIITTAGTTFFTVADYDLTITVPAGDKLLLYSIFSFETFGSGADGELLNYYFPVFNFEISVKKNYVETVPTVTVPLFEAFAKTIDTINGSTFDSDILGRTDSTPTAYASDGEYSLTSIQSGWLLRRFNTKDKPFKIQLDELFKAVNAIYAVALEYDIANDTFILKKEEDAYEDVLIYHLGYVSEYTSKVSTKRIYNTLNLGNSDNVKYEDQFGIQEFNVKGIYEMPVNNIKTTKDLTTPYNIDGLGATFATLNAAATTGDIDTEYDENTYLTVLRRKDGGFETDRAEDFTTAETDDIIPIDTALNLKISPVRNAYRHQNIKSCLYKKSDDIDFRESQFTRKITTRLTGETYDVVETESIINANLKANKINPIEHSFKYKVTPDIRKLILANPNGYFTFTDLTGNEISGYIDLVELKDYKNFSTFTLIEKA